MANTDVSLLDLVEVPTANPGDLFLIIVDPTGDPSTNTIQVSSAANSIASMIIVQETPANSAITIQQGTILYDNTNLYIAIANNQLKLIPLTDF